MSDLSKVIKSHERTGECERCEKTMHSIASDLEAIQEGMALQHYPPQYAVAEVARLALAILKRHQGMQYP